MLSDFPRDIGRTSSTTAYGAWHSNAGNVDRSMALYEIAYYCLKAWKFLRRVDVIRDLGQAAIARAIESQMGFGCADIARQDYHRLRHVRPSRAIITAASVGPEEPAGYGNGSLPETAHESRIFWMKRHAASTVSRRMNNV